MPFAFPSESVFAFAGILTNHAYLVFKVPPDRYDRTFNQTFCNSNTDFESLRDTARGIFSHLDRKHLSTD